MLKWQKNTHSHISIRNVNIFKMYKWLFTIIVLFSYFSNLDFNHMLKINDFMEVRRGVRCTDGIEYFCCRARNVGDKFHSGHWMEFWMSVWGREFGSIPKEGNALVNGVAKLLKLVRQTRRCGALRRGTLRLVPPSLVPRNESSLHICESSLQAVAASTTMNTLGVRK